MFLCFFSHHSHIRHPALLPLIGRVQYCFAWLLFLHGLCLQDNHHIHYHLLARYHLIHYLISSIFLEYCKTTFLTFVCKITIIYNKVSLGFIAMSTILPSCPDSFSPWVWPVGKSGNTSTYTLMWEIHFAALSEMNFSIIFFLHLFIKRASGFDKK